MNKRRQKVLVLGASGMLGHVLFTEFAQVFDTWGTTRGKRPTVLGNAGEIVEGIDVLSLGTLEDLIRNIRPDFILNAVGIIKQSDEILDKLLTISINSTLPHQLEGLCKQYNAKLIHFSTDCIFSGDRGSYRVEEPSDALDFYGRTKFLGEVASDSALTIRSSIIGHELKTHRSLMDWFLKSEGSLKGYRKAIYTGLPTIVLTRIIAEWIRENQFVGGIYQVVSDPINKFDLLNRVSDVYGKNVEIKPSDDINIDRSLIHSQMPDELPVIRKDWDQMIKEMHEHFLAFPYERKSL